MSVTITLRREVEKLRKERDAYRSALEEAARICDRVGAAPRIDNPEEVCAERIRLLIQGLK